jgi:hypothetical protein
MHLLEPVTIAQQGLSPVTTYTSQPIYVREHVQPLPSGDRGKWLADYATRVDVFADGSARIHVNGGSFVAPADAWKLRGP